MTSVVSSLAPSATFVPGYDTCKNVTIYCPVEATLYGSYFNKPANMVLGGLFIASFIWQLLVFLRYRNWSFSLFLGIGTVLEIYGYISRVQLAFNPWNDKAFRDQLTTLILAPTLIAAALSITFKHMVLFYGTGPSIFRPTLYPWLFLGTDVVSIGIQVAGAVMSGQGDDMLNKATVVLTLGVAFQAANMAFCGGLMLLYLYRLRRMRSMIPAPYAPTEGLDATKERKRLKLYIYGMVVSYTLIIIRCIYRIPEMAGGWGGKLMQDETTFLILDGAMIVVAVLVQSALHPAYLFPSMKRAKSVAKTSRDRRGSGSRDTDTYELR